MISVTLLSSYFYCARKLFIEQVLGIKSEIPKEALVKGSIRHMLYEDINRSEEKLVKSITSQNFDEAMGVYKAEYIQLLKKTITKNKEKLRSVNTPLADFFSQLKPLVENEAEYRAKKTLAFASESGYFGSELWEHLTPKIKAEYRISSDEIGLRGVIDELEIYDGFFIPVELKTGKAPNEGVWPGHKIQAGAYALLLESVFGVPVKKAVVRYLDSGALREVLINPFLKEEITGAICSVNELLCSDKIPDFPVNDNKCKSCDLKDVCFDKTALAQKQKI